MRLKLLPIVAILAFLISTPAGAQSSRWGADYFPNVPLTTQDGRVVRFYDDLIKDKIVAVNLIYTTCEYACPLETARLVQVQKLLGDRMGRDVFFYSITIDPDYDTPAVLKEYAEKFGAGPGWLFLTGKKADIELISKKTGLYSEPNPSNPDGHTPTLLVGNQSTGQWMRNSAMDNPKFLARTIGDWLNSWQTAKGNGVSYADAPAFKFDKGQYTFFNHCAACHTIGAGDRVGPDLAGVTTKRERQWLTRFILEPDRVLAERDPIAVSLRSKYKDVRMPNLFLNSEDAEVLIAYMEQQSRAGHAPAGAPPAASAPAALPAVFGAYLRIQQALHGDTIADVASAARAIALEAAAIGDAGAPIRAAALACEQATDIGAARTAFGQLSEALIAYKKDTRAIGADTLKVAYCPMVRKHWLQTSGTIENPYYGKAMSNCGRFVAESSSADNK